MHDRYFHEGLRKGLSVRDITSSQPYFDGWYNEAFRAYNVYDGEGLSPEMLEYAHEIGMPTTKINLCKSTLMSVIGHSEKLRTDVKIGARTNDFKAESQGYNELLHRDWSICKVNDLTSEVQEDQLVAGIGWFNVRRNPMALRHKYIVEHVPWYEMKWDTYSMKGGFEKLRWVCRRQAFHQDYLKLLLPKHTSVIDAIAGERGMSDYFYDYDDWDYDEHRGDFWDDEREMVTVIEAYERVPEMRTLVAMDDGSLVEDDPDLPGERIQRPVMVVKKSIFLGPVKISYTDHEGPNPPLIPMPGYKKTGSNMFVGPMHYMIDPAYNYNFVTNQQLHILSSSKIYIKPDSLHESEIEEDENSAERVRIEVNRRDTLLAFKEDADITRDIVVEREWSELERLQALKQDYRQEIRDVSGVVAAFTGAVEGDMSGKAMENSAELGSTNMAYLLARKRAAEIYVAEQLHQFHLNDIGNNPIELEIKSPFNGQMQQVRFNEDGVISNRMARSKLMITMAAITSSAGFREQTQMKYQDLAGQLANTPYVKYMLEAFMLNDDSPGIDEILAKMRIAEGAAATPEEMAEQQAAAQEAQAQQTQLEQDDMMAGTELKRAQANQANAVAENSAASARKQLEEAESEAETPTAELEAEKLRLEALKIEAEIAKLKQEERDGKLAMLEDFRNQAA